MMHCSSTNCYMYLLSFSAHMGRFSYEFGRGFLQKCVPVSFIRMCVMLCAQLS